MSRSSNPVDRPRPISARELLDRHPAVLLDAYGVLVEASGALPGAAAFLAELERRGTPWAVVSNDASRLPATAAARYRELGLEVPAERVMTSAALLARRFAADGLAGAATLVLGPEDSRRAVAEAGGRLLELDDDEELEALVVADEQGFPFLEGVERALSHLCRALDRGRRPALLLPNPDLLYPKGDGELGLTAGSIALLVEAALELRYPHLPKLAFERLGKPGVAIFDAALELLGTGAGGAAVDRSQVVMVGDQLATDVRGAAAAGLTSALVTTGIHRWHQQTDGPVPDYLLESLVLDA